MEEEKSQGLMIAEIVVIIVPMTLLYLWSLSLIILGLAPLDIIKNPIPVIFYTLLGLAFIGGWALAFRFVLKGRKGLESSWWGWVAFLLPGAVLLLLVVIFCFFTLLGLTDRYMLIAMYGYLGAPLMAPLLHLLWELRRKFTGKW